MLLLFVLAADVCAQPGLCTNGTTSTGLGFCSGFVIDKFSYGFGLSIGDLDNDMQTDDIIVSDAGTHEIIWYRYDERVHLFKKHILYTGSDQLKEAWFEFNHIQKIDGDDWADIVVVSNYKPAMVIWFKNPGVNNWNEAWTPFPLSHDLADPACHADKPTQRPYSVTTKKNENNAKIFDVVVGPGVETNGKENINTDIHIYQNPLSTSSPDWNTKWPLQEMGRSFCDRISFLQAVDIIKGGPQEFLVTSLSEDYTFMLSKEDGIWQSTAVDGTIRSPSHGSLARIDMDNNVDFVVAAGYLNNEVVTIEREERCRYPRTPQTNVIVWYEYQYDGSVKQKIWKRHIIKSNINDAFVARAGNLRGISVDDVVTGDAYSPSNRPASEIKLCFNPQDSVAREMEWPCKTLQSNLPTISFIEIADVDNDGKNDIVALAVGLRDGNHNQLDYGSLLFFKNIASR